MPPRRRLGWAIGMGIANWLIFGKESLTTGEEFIVFLVGASIGLTLALAAERPLTPNQALRKLLYWPVGLTAFWTFLSAYPRLYLSTAIWSLANSAVVGLIIGSLHCVVSLRRLRLSNARNRQATSSSLAGK